MLPQDPKSTFFPPETALWHLTEISNDMCGQGCRACLFNKSGLSHAEKALLSTSIITTALQLM